MDIYKENETLRAALVAVCNAATDGHCAGSVSMDFLLAVPGEAMKCYSRLRAERDTALAQRDELAKAVLNAEALRIEADSLDSIHYGQLDYKIDLAVQHANDLAEAIAVKQGDSK